MPSPQHHSVIVIGAGPGGLGIGALLEGWRPHLVGELPPRFAVYGVGQHVRDHGDDLLTVDMQAMVGAGSVVIRDVPAHALVVGNPARSAGWACTCGARLDGDYHCQDCERVFEPRDNPSEGLIEIAS